MSTTDVRPSIYFKEPTVKLPKIIHHEGWINIYSKSSSDKDTIASPGGWIYKTKESALNSQASGCTDTIKITWVSEEE